MKFEELKLSPGCSMQLQMSAEGGQVYKYGSRFVGSIQDRAVLLTRPRTPAGAPRLRVGQKVAVSLMSGNGICAFSSTIEHVVTTPFPMLHLAFPGNVGFKEVRGATRVTVNQEVNVTNISELDEPSSAGLIADLSTSGTRLELSEAIGRVGDQIEVLTHVAVGRMTKTLRIKGVIRSRIERSTKDLDNNLPAVYGVEFIEADEDVLLVLFAYVYSVLASQ